MLNKECSAIILKKLPPKLKDIGTFTIPCIVGNSHFNKVLRDTSKYELDAFFYFQET